MSQRCEKCGRIPDHKPRVSLDVSELIEQLRYGSCGTAERLEDRNVVENIDKDIEDHQSEILDLQRRITSLTSKCDRLQSMRTMYIGLTSPIRALPNELLTLIFEYCCATNDFGAYPRPKIPALEISHVCSRWRRLALASPGLWSIISVDLNDPANKHERQLVSLFRLFVHRSQDHLLDLDMTLSCWHPPANSNQYKEHPIMEIAVANAHRWKKITIVRFFGSPFRSKAFESLRSLPLLESATLLNEWNGSARVADLRPLKYAPNLTELTLDGYLLDRRALRLPWQRLTHLRLPVYSSDPDSIVTILGSCNNLTHLHIQFEVNEDDEELLSSPGSLVQLPRLRSMSLTLDGLCSSLPVLSSIAVPLLHDLEVCHLGSNVEDTWLTTDIHTLLVQSECSLSKFSLQYCVVSEVGLMTFLRHLPSLRELVVEEMPHPYGSNITTSNLFSSSLHALDGGQIFLPNLSRLTLLIDRTYSDQCPLDDVLLVNAILSRWAPESSHAEAPEIACLREVGLYFIMKEFDWEPYKTLRELEGAGLKLKLYHGTDYSLIPKVLDKIGSA